MIRNLKKLTITKFLLWLGLRGGNDQNLLSNNQKSWVMVRNISIQILKSWRSEIFEKCHWGASGNNQKVSAILLVKPEKLDNDQKYFDTDFKQLISRSVIGEEAWRALTYFHLISSNAPLLYLTALLCFFTLHTYYSNDFSPILYFSSRYFMFSSGVCSEWKGPGCNRNDAPDRGAVF